MELGLEGVKKIEDGGVGIWDVESLTFDRPLQTLQSISSEPFSNNTLPGGDFQPKTAGGYKCTGNLWSMRHQWT